MIKKTILMLLVLVGGVVSASAETETTVYFAINTNYTLKVYIRYGTNNTDGTNLIEMTKTNLTYNNLPIYYAKFKDKYDGLADLWFQAFDGSTWKWEDKVINNTWTGVSTYNGKMHVQNSSGWTVLSTDQTIRVHYKNENSSWNPETIQAYAWNAAGNNGSYGSNDPLSPNTLISKYFDFSYNTIYDYIIFNENGGTDSDKKTGDIPLGYKTEYWVTDGPSSTTATDVLPEDFNYSRPGLTSGNFGTICLPYAATVTGATVFEITGKVIEDNTLKGINLSSVDNLVAGKAYIFKATETTLTATLSGNYTDAITGDAMIGNISSDKYYVPVSMYVVGSDNKIHRVAAANIVWIGRYKGYIDLDNIGIVSAPGLNFIDFDDDATGIEGLEVENIQDVIYDMQGRQVKDVKKGLYIINGKKVLVK